MRVKTPKGLTKVHMTFFDVLYKDKSVKSHEYIDRACIVFADDYTRKQISDYHAYWVLTLQRRLGKKET